MIFLKTDSESKYLATITIKVHTLQCVNLTFFTKINIDFSMSLDDFKLFSITP